MENDETEYCDWAEDKDFVAELDERVRRYEQGIDRGYTWDEVEASIEELKKTGPLNGRFIYTATQSPKRST